MKKISDTKIRNIAIENIVPTLRKRNVSIKNIVINESLKYDKPAVYACNHTNSHDIPTFLDYIKEQRIIVQNTSDLSLITRFFFHIIDVIYANVDKGADNSKLYDEVKKTLNNKNGINKVGIFPEGVFNFSENKFMNYSKAGAARFAISENVPVIPVCLEFENFLCYLNEGSRLYFFESNDIEEKLEKCLYECMKEEDYLSGKRVIVLIDEESNDKKVLSLNDNFSDYESILDSYENIVNNKEVHITYVYLNTDERKATEVIRSEIATMKWYLYESFGIRKNNEKLREDFYSNLNATKEEYPSLDYDLADRRRFKPFCDSDKIFDDIINLEPENNVGYAISKGLEKVRKIR